MDGHVPYLFLQLLMPQLPLAAACGAGALWAYLVWDRYPLPAMLVFLGTGVLATASMGTCALLALSVSSSSMSWSSQAAQILGIAEPMVNATGYALLLGAAFIGRAPYKAEERAAAAGGASPGPRVA